MALSSVTVSAPSQKEEGDLVPFSVEVTNTGYEDSWFLTQVYLNASLFREYYDYIGVGHSEYHSESFLMPPQDVSIFAWVEIFVIDHYEYSSSDEDTVELYVPPPPPIQGSIVDKWVNWGTETRMPIPAAVVADNRTFEIGLRGRNDSDIAIAGGMEVTVTDPDGLVRATPPIDWAGMSPGQELNWEYNITRVDKPGTWTALIRFLARE